MELAKLLCWAVWHLCTTPFIELVELLKELRWLDEWEKSRRQTPPAAPRRPKTPR